jgi:Tol biopolymer transport system component
MASVALRLPIVLAVGLASQGAVAVAPPVRLLLTSDWQPHFRTSEIFVASAANGRTISLTRNEVDDVDPAWSPEGSTIAFASKRDGNWELYTMRPDGSGVRRLTHTAANEREPAWSPDGKQLAFVSDGARNEKGGPIDAIFVMNRDGSGGHRITSPDEGDAAEPAWSPDGTRIAAVEEAAELSRIFTIASDGSDRRYVGPYGAGEPAWSPGGGQLAYTRFRDELNTSDAWVMDVDGTRGRRIATDASTPTWSPDGASIAVVRLPRIVITKDGVYPAGGLTVGVVREDGRGIRNVFARAPRADQSVSESLQWSPDGTTYFGLTWATDGNRLVFGRRTEGRPRDVFSIRPDGSSLRNLTRTPRLFESSPLPSPDGRYVTFARDAISVGRALWLMRSDGTHPRKIAGGRNTRVVVAGRTQVRIRAMDARGRVANRDLDGDGSQRETTPARRGRVAVLVARRAHNRFRPHRRPRPVSIEFDPADDGRRDRSSQPGVPCAEARVRPLVGAGRQAHRLRR